jgi:uncharacterized protein
MRTWRSLKFRHAELGDIEFINEDDRNAVAGYNRDDCVSTWRLRDWLETRRAELIETGTVVPRPGTSEGVPSEALGEWLAEDLLDEQSSEQS